MKKLFAVALVVITSIGGFAQKNEIIRLWPGAVPGEPEPKHEPVQTENTSGNVKRITDITDPALIVFPAIADKNNGAGIIVCPGGGYNILAIDKEGYEIAEWLNSLGFSAFVLQYRVPQKQEGALQDIQRAIRLVRYNADKWNLNPDKLGIIGFSAGGSLCARASTLYNEKKYIKVDEIDELSCKPSFAMLIYPAYLDQGENRSLTPELKVDENTPPAFLFQTADDRLGNSALVYTTALRDAKVPVDLHFLAEGGHGYGLRMGNRAAETWPKLAENWLQKVIENQLD